MFLVVHLPHLTVEKAVVVCSEGNENTGNIKNRFVIKDINIVLIIYSAVSHTVNTGSYTKNCKTDNDLVG